MEIEQREIHKVNL